jgi:hypothetical protein
MTSNPDSPPTGILDAVCCVHFVAANRQRVLLAILEDMGLQLLVPEEVCDEVKGKDANYPGLRARWSRFERSSKVTILPRLDPNDLDPYNQAVTSRFAALRGIPAAAALRQSKDRGEYVVVAHAGELQAEGRTVYALLDDRGGQALAASGPDPIEILDLEALLEHGHRARLDDLARKSDVKGLWNELRRYGVLVPWQGTRLLQHL